MQPPRPCRRPPGAPPACRGVPAGCSCCAPPRTSSSPRATTPPRWTTSPSGPASASRCSTSTSRASASSTWRCSTTTSPNSPSASREALARHRRQPGAGRRRHRRLLRLRRRRAARPSAWSSSPTCATTSDVRAIVDRGTRACVEAIAEVIAADTGVDPERALLLASGLTGMAETSARVPRSTRSARRLVAQVGLEDQPEGAAVVVDEVEKYAASSAATRSLLSVVEASASRHGVDHRSQDVRRAARGRGRACRGSAGRAPAWTPRPARRCRPSPRRGSPGRRRPPAPRRAAAAGGHSWGGERCAGCSRRRGVAAA